MSGSESFVKYCNGPYAICFWHKFKKYVKNSRKFCVKLGYILENYLTKVLFNILSICILSLSRFEKILIWKMEFWFDLLSSSYVQIVRLINPLLFHHIVASHRYTFQQSSFKYQFFARYTHEKNEILIVVKLILLLTQTFLLFRWCKNKTKVRMKLHMNKVSIFCYDTNKLKCDTKL